MSGEALPIDPSNNNDTTPPTTTTTTTKPRMSQEDCAALRPAVQALLQSGCCAVCAMRFADQRHTDVYLNAAQDLKVLFDIDFVPTERVCSTCLGIMPMMLSPEFWEKIRVLVHEARYEHTDAILNISVPLCLNLRHFSAMLFLESSFPTLYGAGMIVPEVGQVKEVLKIIMHALVPKWLGVPYNIKSAFKIQLSFESPENEVTVELLHRLGHKRARKAAETSNMVSAPMLAGVLAEVDRDEFKREVSCPPDCPTTPIAFPTVQFMADSIFVAGRYCKYSRELSQTPWIIEGERKSDQSVQELLQGPILDAVKVDDCRFSSAGREDIDVRMLGAGRPFILELVNPRRRVLPRAELTKIQQTVNANTTMITMRDLQQIERDETSILKDGEETKTKTYRCIVWTEKDYSTNIDELSKRLAVKDLVLQQRTPLRVMHRRVISVRPKTIHDIRFEVIKPHFLRMWLSTQAGTYIKEFVHGDFGRTQPNLGTLLECSADIITLDVEAINMPWPPPVLDEVTVDVNVDGATVVKN